MVGGLLALALASTGCSGFLTNFAAGSSIRVFAQAAPAVQVYADIDFAEGALPGSITTLEGLMLVQPRDEQLHELLARSYASLAFGFYQDHMEEALASDNEPLAEHYRARASNAYRRARALTLEMMGIWHPVPGGAEGQLRGIEPWNQYLARFDRREQAGQLFWGAYAWAQYIGINQDDVSAIADLPFVLAMAERVKQLDPTFNFYAPLALLAGLRGSVPEQIGGRPDLARQGFEEAIAATERRNLMYLVVEARIVAVALQDRALYRRLLEETINAGDIDPGNRLSNQLAKRRAFRYLAQIDQLFEPEGAAGSSTPDGE
jgi:hypothetical protein